MIVYTVTARITDPARAAAWVEWLRGGHMRAVCEGGALHAALSRHDDHVTYEVRYMFADRDSFAAYERIHAPALRAEGLALFPPGPDFALSRNVAEVIAEI